MSKALPTTRIAGLDITTLSRSDIAQVVLADHQDQQKSGFRLPPKLMFSVNGQGVSLLATDPEFLPSMLRADYLHADGQSIVFASRLLTKRPILERSATTDLFHDIARVAEDNNLSFFVLGGTRDINPKAVRAIQRLYPKIRIVGNRHGFESDKRVYLEAIRKSRPDIVWLAFGKPKQEYLAEWLANHLTGVTLIKPCGGLYEFLTDTSGNKRAPELMQRLGLEWLHRAWLEPRRLLWRYLSTSAIAITMILSHAVVDAFRPQRPQVPKEADLP